MDKRKKREKSMILALGRSFLARRFAARRTSDVKALWRVKIINIMEPVKSPPVLYRQPTYT